MSNIKKIIGIAIASIGTVCNVVLNLDTYAKLLLHLNNNVTDSATGKTVTNNNVTFSDVVKKLGSHSAYFNGTNAYLTVPDSDDWYFGTGNFTIDFWVNFSSVSVQQTFISKELNTDNYWYISLRTGPILIMSFVLADTLKGYYSVSWSPAINTWYHLAFERVGTTAKFFIDGISQNLTETVAFGTKDVGNISSVLGIGKHINSTLYVNGYMDELRISKGIVRWTSNFTPPVSEYGPAIKKIVGVTN